MRKFLAKAEITVCVLLSIVLLCGCHGSDTKKQVVSDFATKVLNAPNDEVEKIYLVEESTYDTDKMRNTISDFLGKSASDKIIEDSLNMSSDIMALQFQAIRRKAQIVVDKIESVEQVNENQFTYSIEAKLTEESNKEENIKLSGIVQFDSQDKIEYISINSSDFDEFMKN